jgi:hypothetical protein
VRLVGVLDLILEHVAFRRKKLTLDRCRKRVHRQSSHALTRCWRLRTRNSCAQGSRLRANVNCPRIGQAHSRISKFVPTCDFTPALWAPGLFRLLVARPDSTVAAAPTPPRCYGCARPMRLVRRTPRFEGLPGLCTFECRACGVWHIDEAAAEVGHLAVRDVAQGLKPEHLSSPSHEAPADAGASPAPRRRSTARSIWRRLTLSLGFRRFHPPHEIVDKARERTLERFAPVANRLAFGR